MAWASAGGAEVVEFVSANTLRLLGESVVQVYEEVKTRKENNKLISFLELCSSNLQNTVDTNFRSF